MKKSGMKLLVFAVVLMLCCTVVVRLVDTSAGQVDVKMGKLLSPQGKLINYKIYIPKTATTENPAPCVIYGVGGACSLDNGSMYAIEASRRGAVVITYDAAGNGLSERNDAVGASFNAEMAYQLAMSLDFVDHSKLIQGGHSMGGWYSMEVSQEHQENVVLQFSVGMNYWGNADKGYDFNFAYIVGTGDESALVRTTNYNTLNDMFESPGLKTIFGLGDGESIEVGKVYGDFSNETGRVVMTPKTIHIWEITSPEVCSDYLRVVADSVQLPNPIPESNLIYWIKDIALVFAFVALGAFALAVTMLLFDTKAFAGLKLPVNRYVGFEPKTPLWWVAVLVLTLISGGLFVWAYGNQGSFPWINGLGNTNGKAVWSVCTGVLMAVFILVYHFVWGRKKGANARDYGLSTTTDGGFNVIYLLKALVFALAVSALTYGFFRLFTLVTMSNIHWNTVEFNALERNKVVYKFLPLLLTMIPFVFANCIAQKIVIKHETDDTKSMVAALVKSNIIGSLVLVILYFALVIAALCFHTAIYPLNRAYIGGESALGAAAGFWIANSIAYYLNRKSGSIWAGFLTALILTTWFGITAAGIVY